jgi:hypothetical protein
MGVSPMGLRYSTTLAGTPANPAEAQQSWDDSDWKNATLLRFDRSTSQNRGVPRAWARRPCHQAEMRWTLHGYICGVSDVVDLRDRDAGGVVVEPLFAQEAAGEIPWIARRDIGRLRSVRGGTSVARGVLPPVRDGALGGCGLKPRAVRKGRLPCLKIRWIPPAK